MQSCPSRRESEAAPSNGGLSSIHAAFVRLSACVGWPHVRGGARVRAGGSARRYASISASISASLSAWLRAVISACPAAIGIALLVCIASLPLGAHAAGTAASSTPVIPALQSLINSATVAPASEARPAHRRAEAASAPSPASQAEIARSLDSVIATLDNDRPAHRARRATQKTARRLAHHRPARAGARAAESRLARRDCVGHRVVRIGHASGPHARALLGRALQRGRQRALHHHLRPGPRAFGRILLSTASRCWPAGAHARPR